MMYPAKNGPRAVAKRVGIRQDQISANDPHDEITGDAQRTQKIAIRYGQELAQLSSIGNNDMQRNLRHMVKLGDGCKDVMMSVIEQYLETQELEGIFIGDRVQRGPDWKWGDQDGGVGHEGTVRGLRQWHPSDPPAATTEAVVLWDHGLYGNYRFGYHAAYDVKVTDRGADEKQQDKRLSVGDRVTRQARNWRWGQQDGGDGAVGTVVELYASPAPFEGGCRVALLWDHAKAHWFQKAEAYLSATRTATTSGIWPMTTSSPASRTTRIRCAGSASRTCIRRMTTTRRSTRRSGTSPTSTRC